MKEDHNNGALVSRAQHGDDRAAKMTKQPQWYFCDPLRTFTYVKRFMEDNSEWLRIAYDEWKLHKRDASARQRQAKLDAEEAANEFVEDDAQARKQQEHVDQYVPRPRPWGSAFDEVG